MVWWYGDEVKGLNVRARSRLGDGGLNVLQSEREFRASGLETLRTRTKNGGSH